LAGTIEPLSARRPAFVDYLFSRIDKTRRRISTDHGVDQSRSDGPTLTRFAAAQACWIGSRAERGHHNEGRAIPFLSQSTS